jgi:hypothetical protein
MNKTRVFLLAAIAALVFVCIVIAVIAFAENTSSDRTLSAPVNTFDVKTYGAVGDGVTDDGPSIVAAAAAAVAAGHVLYFPSGTYYVSNTAILPEGWPTGWKGAGGEGQASYIKSIVTAGNSQTAWDFRWITP